MFISVTFTFLHFRFIWHPLTDESMSKQLLAVIVQSNQTSTQSFIWIVEIKIQNGEHTEKMTVGTLGRKIRSGVSHSRESLLLRRVAALRLRAKKDSVGVMSRSTIRLSHGLRRRLRADTRGRRQLLPERHRYTQVLHANIATQTLASPAHCRTGEHSHGRRWFSPAAHPHKHTRTHACHEHTAAVWRRVEFYAAFVCCGKHRNPELNSPK